VSFAGLVGCFLVGDKLRLLTRLGLLLFLVVVVLLLLMLLLLLILLFGLLFIPSAVVVVVVVGSLPSTIAGFNVSGLLLAFAVPKGSHIYNIYNIADIGRICIKGYLFPILYPKIVKKDKSILLVRKWVRL
jgi:hypothetical protein